MDLTIIIPTNRPHKYHVERVIKNINSFDQGVSYEIVVVSQEEIEGENVRWHKEEGRLGPIRAFNDVSSSCETPYVACMVDDHILSSPIGSSVHYLDAHFQNRRFPITSLVSGPQNYNPVKGQVLGDSPIDFDVECYPLCKFPVFHKRALDELGGFLFHPELFYHAGDILLGYYMGMNGEPIMYGPTGIRPHNPEKDSTYEVSDCETVKRVIKKYVEGEKEYIA